MSSYLKGGGQVLAAGATALFLVLDIRDVAPDDGILWQWWALGAFVVFMGITTWTQITQLLRIRGLINSRPELSVSLPDPSEEWWLLGKYSLVVSNGGAPTEVSAQVRVIDGLGFIRGYYQNTFQAVWEGDTGKAQLLTGLEARMLLIEPELDRPSSPPYFSKWLIAYWNKTSRKASLLETTSWVTFGTSPPPELTFEVIISANPSEPNGPLKRKYHLNGQGLRKIE